MVTIEELQAKKAEILIEGVNGYLGGSDTFSEIDFLEKGIYQVFGLEVGKWVEQNLDYSGLATEFEISKAFEAAEVEECPACGWWCDDLYYDHPELYVPVCSDCSEGE